MLSTMPPCRVLSAGYSREQPLTIHVDAVPSFIAVAKDVLLHKVNIILEFGSVTKNKNSVAEQAVRQLCAEHAECLKISPQGGSLSHLTLP